MSAARKFGRRVTAWTTSIVLVLAATLPLIGVASASHGGATDPSVDIDQVALTPDSANIPSGGTCVQFQVEAREGGVLAEGETVDVVVSISDDDGAAGAGGEVSDLSVSFCDPDGAGPGIVLAAGPAVDDTGGTEAPATRRGDCPTGATGICIFGVSVTDAGTGTNAGGSGTVTAFADVNNNDAQQPSEPFDVSTITVGAGGSTAVANITCTPAAQTRPEGGRAEFTCTATNASGQPLSGVQITLDVTSGPNAEEIGPITCAVTGVNGSTPTPGPNPTPGVPTPGACGYNDAGNNTQQSPPGTDTVVFCTQLPGVPGQQTTAGCDPHELNAQGNESATVTWVGPAARISCTPDGLTAPPGSSVLVTCQVTDLNSQPIGAGQQCNFSEVGPGTLATTTVVTNAQGQCTVSSTTASNELGTQTITGALAGGPPTNCQSGANQGTPTPNAPAGTVCSDTATINWAATTQTPVTDCADGSDNDGDARIDLDDRGCRSATDPTEAGPFASAVTIRLRRAAPRGFTGQVASAFVACQRGRRVAVRRVGGRVVGRDTTNRNGNYFIRSRARRGRFFARVAPRIIGVGADEVLCRGDRSPTIRIRRRR